MFDGLLETLRRVLFQKWKGRLKGIRVGAERAKTSGLSVQEAYTEAYNAAYFDAVSDLVDEGLLREPPPVTKTPVPLFGAFQPSEDVN